MKYIIIKMLSFFNLKFKVTQYYWGRKLFKGTYYLIKCDGLLLNNNPFWSDKEIKSCQSHIIRMEYFLTTKHFK